MGSVSLRLVKVCQIFWSCLFLSKVNMVVVKVQAKKVTGPVASSLPVTVRDTERPGESSGGYQAHPDSLHGGRDGDAAGDVPHPALLGKLQGCWKGEPVPSRSDCRSTEGEGSVGMHCKKIHAQGAVGQGCCLQGNSNQHFHQWSRCS